jgi:putative phosphoesterase
MLIGIISDTHDNLTGLQKAIQIFKDHKIEMLIHCGDWNSLYALEFFDKEMKDLRIPIKSVVGNNTGDVKRILMNNNKIQNPIEWSEKVTLSLDIDGKKTIIYHGDDYAILDALIESQRYDIIFTGHTHSPRNEVVGKTLVLNPGSTSYARESKIISEASIAIYNSQTNKAEIIYF